MLRRRGRRVNVKRVRRLCVLAGLKLPARKRRKRRGRAVEFPVVAEYPNQVWAYDFVFDWCDNGRQLEFLTIVDEFTRKCMEIEVDHRMGARQVGAVLERVMRRRGVPAFVRSDNGPEFIAHALQRMLAVKGVACRHIDPGSPWQNGKNERFNGTFRDECTNRETFHHRDHARAVSRLFRRYYNHASYCLTSPCACQIETKLSGRSSCGGSALAPCLLDQLVNHRPLQVPSVKYPGPIGQRVVKGYLAAFRRQPQRLGAHTDQSRGFGEVHPAFGFLPCRRMNGDLMMAA
jgi:hypothetical protein